MANVDMNEDLQEKVKEKRNPKGRREAANLKNPPRLRSGKEIKDLRKEFHTLADQVDDGAMNRLERWRRSYNWARTPWRTCITTFEAQTRLIVQNFLIAINITSVPSTLTRTLSCPAKMTSPGRRLGLELGIPLPMSSLATCGPSS